MTKEEKFNVAIAAFEAALRNHSLRRAYLINFNKCNQRCNSEDIYISWKEWALSTPPYQWVAGAFFWNNTPQQHYVWKDLDYYWLQWLCRNLNY